MTSPRHSPPPSAAAPRPKGILKNASESSSTAQMKDSEEEVSPQLDENGNRLAWDESNLTLHEIERETQAARMKIDEPKTPFVRSASLGPMDEDTGFDLDSQGGPSYFPQGEQSTDTDSSALPATSTGTGSRRGSAAEQLAANTMANAGRRTSNAGSATSSTGGGGSRPPTAVGLDSVDMAVANSSGGATTKTSRSDSRSPSFTLPSSRRSSSIAGDRSREGVREEMRNRDDGMEGLQQDEQAFEEEEGPLDPEAKAKQAAFAQKRNAHYGNEAEAMKVAAALAAQGDEDDEEEEDEASHPGGIPPVPPLQNGRTM